MKILTSCDLCWCIQLASVYIATLAVWLSDTCDTSTGTSAAPKCQTASQTTWLGPFHAAAKSGAVWEHESFAARALLPALKRRPPGYTVPYETRWTGDRSQESSMATARPSQGWLGVWWRTRTPASPSRWSPERFRSSSKMLMGQSSSGYPCSCPLRTHRLISHGQQLC